jgi:hypothetical protein
MKVIECNGRIYENVVLSEGEGDDIVLELTAHIPGFGKYPIADNYQKPPNG